MSENSKEIGMHQKDARILTDQFYKTKMCPHMTKPEGCLRSMKDNCPYAHSELELRSPPDLVKTAMCKLFLKQSCSKTSSECAYAHQFEELRHTESFYKTFVCKFWTAGYCKAGDLCRYAHGEEELRKINVKEENTGNLNPPQKSAACNEIHYSTDSFETKVTPGYINNVTNNGHCATPPMATYPIYQNYVSDTTPGKNDYRHVIIPQYQTLGNVTLRNHPQTRCDECYYLMQYYIQRYIDCCTQYHC